MRWLAVSVLLIAASSMAQMHGTNFVTVMFDRQNGIFYPSAATDFVTNNTTIENLQIEDAVLGAGLLEASHEISNVRAAMMPRTASDSGEEDFSYLDGGIHIRLAYIGDSSFSGGVSFSQTPTVGQSTNPVITKADLRSSSDVEQDVYVLPMRSVKSKVAYKALPVELANGNIQFFDAIDADATSTRSLVLPACSSGKYGHIIIHLMQSYGGTSNHSHFNISTNNISPDTYPEDPPWMYDLGKNMDCEIEFISFPGYTTWNYIRSTSYELPERVTQ